MVDIFEACKHLSAAITIVADNALAERESFCKGRDVLTQRINTLRDEAESLRITNANLNELLEQCDFKKEHEHDNAEAFDKLIKERDSWARQAADLEKVCERLDSDFSKLSEKHDTLMTICAIYEARIKIISDARREQTELSDSISQRADSEDVKQ